MFRRPPPPPFPRPLLRELATAAAMAGIGAAVSAMVFLFYREPQRVSEWSAKSIVNHELVLLLKQRIDRLEDLIRTHRHP